MRILITLALTLSSIFSFGQTFTFNISGVVKNTAHAKYAYLTTLSQQRPISSDKIFMIAPIINGKFYFHGKFNLEGKAYQQACLIIDDNGKMTKEELQSRFKELIWVTGREENIKRIILEDLKLSVEERDQTISSKIFSGGVLTKQLDEMHTAIIKKNRKLLEFIKAHPDSPLSFDQVEETAEFMDDSNREKLESRSGSIKQLYGSLSKRLRNSKRGLALKRLINQKFNDSL